MNEVDDDQGRVMELLEPFLERIFSIFPAALEKYNDQYPAAIRAEHENRTAAGCVYDHVWNGFKSEFMEEDGFHFLNVRGLNVLNIRDQLVIRAKKVDANGLHRNHDSQQQKDFDRQVPLPDMPQEAIRIVAGYEPDVAFSEVQRVMVRRPLVGWVSQIIESTETPHWVDITPQELPFGSNRRTLAQ